VGWLRQRDSELGSMSKKDEYTAYALALLDLADQHRYRSTNHKDEHPLVKERLGDGHTDA
jgi:hypothetical protein